MHIGPDGSRFSAFLASVGRIQARAPWACIAVCMVVGAAFAFLARGLELRTRFDQLLPEGQPSVIELHRVLERTGAASKIVVVLDGEDRLTLRGCADALVTELAKVGPPVVARAEDGFHAARAFLMPRAGFFSSLEELQKLDRDFEARWDYEVSHAVGTALDEDEPPPPFSAAEVKKRFRKDDQEDDESEGYFQSKDGRTILVVATTSIAGGDLDGSRAAFTKVKATVTPALAAPVCNGVTAGYAGDLVSSMIEYGHVKEDLIEVGVTGVGAVLAVILIYFMRVRALVAMGLTIAVGLALTFGLTRIFIGHLNVATGFLVSIVAGNGINAGIIYIARYLEERRHGHPVEVSVVAAHVATWPATLTAAAAAGASYGALWITDFRAFKHFAFIGAAGMLVCWVTTYALLPALLVVLERVHPFATRRAGKDATLWRRLRDNGSRYDAPFAAVVPRMPTFFAVVGVLLTLVGSVLAVRYVARDPMDYDLLHVRSEQASGDSANLARRAATILGAAVDAGMVVVVDRFDQVEPLVRALEQRREAAPAGEKPFQAVHSILDFVPGGQADKAPVLESIRERLVRARDKGFIKDPDWEKLKGYLPPEDVKPFGVADLPDELARNFSDRGGQRGVVLLIEPTAGQLDSDLHYLLRWAASFRETKLPNGDVVRGSGRAVIFADILRTIVADMPVAVALSFALTAAAVFLVFRRGSSALAVVVALLAGVVWLVMIMAIFGIRINMFNFVALPITFGVGVDYAVNLMQRYDDDRELGIMHALRTTGGAIVLCSLTTTFGYLALMGSVNHAIRSMGMLAVIGEVCCLSAALLVLASILLLRERRRRG